MGKFLLHSNWSFLNSENTISLVLLSLFGNNARLTRLSLIMSSLRKPIGIIAIYLIVTLRVRQQMFVTFAFQGPTLAIDVDVDVFAQFLHVVFASTRRRAMRHHPRYHRSGGLGFSVPYSVLQ